MAILSQPLLFEALGTRQVVADFSAGILSSDGGVMLLRQIDRGLGLVRRLSQCFVDERKQQWVDHSLEHLLSQRLYALALGYEDLNDHAQLRRDPLLAAACEKLDPTGKDRKMPQFQDAALAGPSTLNRLELSNNKDTRCHKIEHVPAKIEACLLEMSVRCLPKHTEELVLDLDAMGTLVNGGQEGRFFNSYYDGYCYLPLYVMCGNLPLWAQLQTADHDAADGALPAMQKIVAAVRQRFPKARIIIRGDSGFAREDLMAWCEAQWKVYYCLGLAQNSRLLETISETMAQAQARHVLCGGVATRVFSEFRYQTLKSWTCERRVVAKAEVMAEGKNPRFVVTNLPAEGFEAGDHRFETQALYEAVYCARGQMENVLKQQVLDLKSDRLSTHHLESNQLRLWLSALAYLLLERMRSVGLSGTALAKATVGTIRLKVLKVAAQVTLSVRRIYIQFSAAWPNRQLFATCQAQLQNADWPSG